MRRTGYHSMLRMELEIRTKRNPEQVQKTVDQAKKPKTSDSSGRVNRVVAGVPSARNRIVEFIGGQGRCVILVFNRAT